MDSHQKLYVAFAGNRLIARDLLSNVARLCKTEFDAGNEGRIALFDDETGRPIDIDLTGTEAEVLEKLTAHPIVGEMNSSPNKMKRPGRPKLGVVSREISLLPRHWKWLAAQRGGASATLRRLVDASRKNDAGQEHVRKAIDAAHRFMWDIAGDQPGFEDASRSLFTQDYKAFAEYIANWPAGIRGQLERFAKKAQRPNEFDLTEHPSTKTRIS